MTSQSTSARTRSWSCSFERRYGLFRRSITLPPHVMAEAIEASAEDGVLLVVVPKVEEVKPKRIEVHAVRAQAPATAGAPDSTRA
ncbi:MAG: Hsp20/alpha crystallin family protein [Pseudonocardiaceae bacterium]